jgi:hypothetical protein
MIFGRPRGYAFAECTGNELIGKAGRFLVVLHDTIKWIARQYVDVDTFRLHCLPRSFGGNGIALQQGMTEVERRRFATTG